MRLDKRKFTLGYMALLIVFIIVGIFMVLFSSNNETPEIDESLIKKTPGLGTMLQIKEILIQRQLDSSIIDIEVSPDQNVIIELQGNDFVSEDMLLKDSYNIFTSSASVNEMKESILTWYSKIDGQNVNVLTINMTKSQRELLKSSPYTDIPTIAAQYMKHDQLK